MSLVPCAGSDRAWVWTVLADFADEEPKKEQLAIRFKNAESKFNHFIYAWPAINVLNYSAKSLLVKEFCLSVHIQIRVW